MHRTSQAAALLTLTLALLAPAALLAGYPEAVAAFNGKDFAQAEKEFRAVVEAHPDYAPGYLMLGRSQLEQGEAAEAVASLERAVALQPGDAVSLYFLGRARLAADRPDAALEALASQSLTQVPDQVREAYAGALAGAAEKVGGPGGVAALEKAVAQDPDEAALWLSLGRLHRAAEQPQEALAATEKAFKLSGEPSIGRLAVRDAFSAAQAEEDREARKDWYRQGAAVAEQLAQADPSPETWLLLGEARMGAGAWDDAVEALRQADPSDARTRYYLGQCSVSLGQADQALTELQAALGNDPDQDLEQHIYAALGSAHRLKEEFVEAAAAYREAGDQAKVAEMEKLADAAKTNHSIEARRQRCRERQQELESVVSDNRDLVGTPEFNRLRRSWHDLRVECSDVLEIPPFPEGK